MGCSGEPKPEPGLPTGRPFGAVPTPEFRLAWEGEVGAALFELALLFGFVPEVVPEVAPAVVLAEGAVDVPVPPPLAEPEADPLLPAAPPPLPLPEP